MVDRMRRLSKLEAGIGKTAAMWAVLRDMHPLMRQKVVDEAEGYENHTRPPKLGDLASLGLEDGVQWLMKNDWDVAYSIEFDLDLVRGEGQGYDIAEFCVEREEGGSIEEDQREAAGRLEKLKHLPPQRWCEVYADELEEA
jgi:hypothetical protein